MKITNINTISQLRRKVDNMMEELVEGLQLVRGGDIGLDDRAGYNIRIDSDELIIVVSKYGDRSLRYYAGFEYVDDQHRTELGDYVIYSVESQYGDMCERLMDCFHYLNDSYPEDDEDDEDDEAA